MDSRVAALLLLLVPTLAVTLRLDHLGWLPYTLVRDLPRTGAAVALLALGAAAARRVAPARWLRLARAFFGVVPLRAALVAALAAGTLLVALSEVMPTAEPGLTLRTGTVWRHADPAEDTQRVDRLSLGPQTGPPWRHGRAFTATLSGWVYAPLPGRYDFALGADRGAVLEVNGRRVVRYGRTPETEPQGITSDPERGLHRGAVWLATGFHRLEVASVHESGGPRLLVRWIPPRATSLRRIPAEFLMPDEATPALRHRRALHLAGRRAGILLLVVTGTFGLSELLARANRAARPTAGNRDAAAVPSIGATAVLLTSYILLAQPDDLRPASLAILYWGLAGALALGTALYLRSAWVARGYPRGWAPSLPITISPGLRTGAAAAVLLAIQATLTWRFVDAVAGRLLTSIDHGAFLYRYHAIAKTFPRLVNYDPWWNAGMVDESTILTGAALVHMLTWPVRQVLPLESAYQWFVPLVGIVTIPWALFAATRLLGYSRLAGLVAAILAMAPAHSYFVWLFNFGTLGALVTASLVPLAFALAWRIFILRDQRWWMVAAFLVTVNLGMFWPLFPLMLLPALCWGGILLRHRLRRRDLVLGAGVVAVVLSLNANWLISVPGLSAAEWIMETPETPETPSQSAGSVLNRVAAQARDIYPVGLVAGAAGLLLLPRLLRGPYGGLVGSLLVIGAIGPIVLPGLELSRFAFALAFALVPLAAGLLARRLRSLWAPSAGPGRRTLALVTLVLLVVQAERVWVRYGDQHRLRLLHFMSAELEDLSRWLRAHSTTDARIFLTPGVEQIATGYVAHMAVATGRALLAQSPYNPRWGYGAFLAPLAPGLPELRSQLERLNVRYVVAGPADAERWNAMSQEGWLRRRASLSRVSIYETDAAPTYLVDGGGTVTFDYNRIAVTLEAPRDEVVLKFQWQPGLYVVPSLPIEPAEIGALRPLIRVRAGTVRAFEIRY